jgi:hypothetical protein
MLPGTPGGDLRHGLAFQVVLSGQTALRLGPGASLLGERSIEILNPNKTGLVLAALMGGWHLLWALLVAAGVAQACLNFVFWMHFLTPIYVVKAFQPGIAVVLIVVTAVLGYLIGCILAALWNWIHR